MQCSLGGGESVTKSWPRTYSQSNKEQAAVRQMAWSPESPDLHITESVWGYRKRGKQLNLNPKENRGKCFKMLWRINLPGTLKNMYLGEIWLFLRQIVVTPNVNSVWVFPKTHELFYLFFPAATSMPILYNKPHQVFVFKAVVLDRITWD